MNLFDGSWHYLAIVYDSSTGTMTGYVDGTSLGSETSALSSFGWSSPTVLLGGWVDNGVNQPFVGDAAQIAVYGTALSSARIDAHDQAASPPPPAPTVTGVSPNSGSTAGGGSVTITGTNFTSDSTVKFGANAATGVDVVSSTSITATVPAGSAGTVDVQVTADGGTSQANSADQFTYLTPPPAPTVSSVSPSSGPAAGGSSVTITGTGFITGSSVSFGANAATDLDVLSSTSITATSPAGSGTVDVTVSNANGTSAANPPADQFTYNDPAATTPDAVTGGTDHLTDQSVTLLGTINPAGQSCSYDFEWGTSSYGTTTPTHPAGSVDGFDAATDLTGLAGGTTYDYRIDATCDGTTYYGANMTFTTLGPVISTTETASNITYDTASLAGSVTSSPSGVTYHFDYGPSTAYGSQSPASDAPVGSGGAATAALVGLTPSTTYHYRLVAISAAGTSYGPDETFTTTPPPPTVTANQASHVFDTRATVTGTITSVDIGATTYYVEWGTDDAYTRAAAGTDPYTSQSTSVAAGPSGFVDVPLTGLTDDTSYHWRIVATNAYGTTYGADQTFTTLISPPALAIAAQTNVSDSGATMNGAIDDQGEPGTCASISRSASRAAAAGRQSPKREASVVS